MAVDSFELARVVAELSFRFEEFFLGSHHEPKGFLELNVFAFFPEDINTNEHDEKKPDENGKGPATDNQDELPPYPVKIC